MHNIMYVILGCIKNSFWKEYVPIKELTICKEMINFTIYWLILPEIL